MFAEILTECRELAAKASEEVKGVRQASAGKDRSAMSASAYALLREADENLESLQSHAKHAEPAEKVKLAKEEQVLRAELRAVAQELEQAKREYLLGDSCGGTEKLFRATEERKRSTAITRSLEKSGTRIKESSRTMLETETIGMEALMELRKQREQLHGVKDRVSDLGTNMKDANKHLGELEKPAWASILWGR